MTVVQSLVSQPLDAEAKRRHRKAQKLASARAVRKQTVDERRVVTRRLRRIEADLRAELARQGRAVRIVEEIEVHNVAAAMVQLEIWTAERSRGAFVDIEAQTRVQNIISRGLSALNLRPQLAEEPPPRLDEYLDQNYRQEDGA